MNKHLNRIILKRRASSLVVNIVIAMLFVLLLNLLVDDTPVENFEVFPTMINPSTQDSLHAYFTSSDQVLEGQLLELISNARFSIHAALFELDSPSISEALIEAHSRGVDVKIIADNGHSLNQDDSQGEFSRMSQKGIIVRYDFRSALMHNKFIILDNHTTVTGSTNITQSGLTVNNNNVLVIKSDEVAVIYQREFNELWNGQFGIRSPSTVQLQRTSVGGSPISIFFAPEDDVMRKLIPLVQGAKKSLRVMALSFTHDDLGEAILHQHSNGIDVKVIFERRGSETKHSELPRLHCAGVLAKQDGNSGTFHHKVIVIDERIVITGSFNFSNNANKRNDENLVILDDLTIASLYAQEFERRWAETITPDIECP